MKTEAWIGVDLDGTLAKYDGWKGEGHIGEPIPLMVERVKRWLKEGKRVKIVTARMNPLGRNVLAVERTKMAIAHWTQKHIGVQLEATCSKDFGMTELWDDRAIQVGFNNGIRIGSVER